MEKLNKEEYPELYEVMLQYADYDDVDEWIYELTTDIYDADKTKKFPRCVSQIKDKRNAEFPINELG